MQDTKVKTKALDKSNCAAARLGGKEAGVKTTSPRTETGYEAGDADELAPQSEVPVSASQVKPGVVWRKSRPLPGEACAASRPSRGRSHGTVTGNGGGEPAGVSSGRSSTGNEPGVGVHSKWSALNEPDGLTRVRRTKLIGTAETAPACQLALTLNVDAGSVRSGAAEKDRGQGELWERILSPANLNEAWRRVRRNGGAAGIDGMSVTAFPAFHRANWTKVSAKLQAGIYQPSPVRRTLIPKKSGGERPLGIPTVLDRFSVTRCACVYTQCSRAFSDRDDRVIQQALAQELSGVFEVEFSENSYAYRPGRNANDALRAVQSAAAAGYTEAVDCDLKGFFDHVDHDLLMARVAAKVRDQRVLRLIGRYLRAGVVLPDGTREPTPRGVPQGGPLSPLLANIMLTPLDRALESRGLRFARYADDFLILVQSRAEAERVMTDVVRFVENQLKLTVNAAKSRVAPLASCTFLGCRITRSKIRWSEEAVEEFREKVRRLTGRTWGVSMDHRLGSLGRYVSGWFGYYGSAARGRRSTAVRRWSCLGHGPERSGG